jgi:hypothetical protein|nr:MAG TPA: hypothetical protein [Caudoviricetes sp.]
MKFDKELPADLQVKTILQNFDKKQAECDALKKKNEELKKKLEQKDILYRNMLNRFSNMSTQTNIDYKDRYEQLKAKNAESGMRYSRILMDLTKANGMLESIKAIMNSANEKIEAFCSDTEQEDNKSAIVVKGDNDSSFPNTQSKKFVSYVREIIANFKETGSLRGIGMIAREYGVSSLTKEQFFRYGLNNEVVTDEYIISVYEKAKKHL